MLRTLPEWYVQLDSAEEAEKNVVALVKHVTQSHSPVAVSDLKGGITNRLIIAEQDGLRLLVRAFGSGTNTFIDREREYAVHTELQELGLATPLFCKFGNGLMYGYAPGRTSKPAELSHEPVMRNVARRLAQWHATLKIDSVQARLGREIGDFWAVLEKWVSLCPNGVLALSKQQLQAEFVWLRSELAEYSRPNVFGHCDLLSANILLPKPGSGPADWMPEVPTGTDPAVFSEVCSDASFIDYEYATPCPRAFDIANHFQEWQGYECIKSNVPQPVKSSEKLAYWCQNYLTSFQRLTETPQNFDDLLVELQAFWGMPGFYWGVWSAIQSKSSKIDFGYHDYAISRFQEYTDWKQKWTKKA